HALGVMKIVEKRLGGSLAFVVASPWPKGIDVAPVALGLRTDFRVAIGFGGRRLKGARPSPRSQIQDIQRAKNGGLQRVDRIALIVLRRGRASKVVDLVHIEIELVDHVLGDDAEHRVRSKTLDVAIVASRKIIEANHTVSA